MGDDAEIAASILENLDEDLLLQQVSGVFMLWWHWAYFEITVTSPILPSYNSLKLVLPEPIPGGEEKEFVYDICDWGNKLSTSKGEEMYSVGMSMCKMYYTIEKIIFILINRLKEQGVATDTEVQVAFEGHLLGQRKAFESIINLNYNVVVTNFDPGAWGERYLEIVKQLADKGYGYPSEAPRDIYKIKKKTVSPTKR
ncbi:MAG: virulence factor [Legionellales bacterium]|nr:virulence factor [Legionellales bacterium]